LTRSWLLDSKGYFEQGIKWDAPLGLDFGLSLRRLHTMTIHVERPWEFMAKGLDFGLWPLEASHYAWPKAPLTIFYWLFSTHFFGLSTKFGHSIPRPLDLDGHSVTLTTRTTILTPLCHDWCVNYPKPITSQRCESLPPSVVTPLCNGHGP
jgi:hypothetical protein